MSNVTHKILREELDIFATGLFKYLDKRFAATDDRLDRLESRMDKIEGAIDTIGKNQEIDQQERSVMNHQLTRYEGWSHQIAKKVKIKLNYE
ncbi:MAG TPA: hypothetical protein VNX65_02055 [Patescibacteria group bacterium]|jgi:hypothetical protein|nr:hypothetical protein [Patescibacteria group bacterium]